MTAEAPRRRPGRTRAGSRGAATGPEARRGRARVAGERSAERRRRLEPPPAASSRPRLPALPRPRPPRPTRAPAANRLRPDVWRRLTAALAAGVLLAAVGVGYLAVQLRQAQATQSAAGTAQVLATRYAEQLLSYHHRRLDGDFAQSTKLLTDAFVREYTRATDEVREQALRDEAVIKASVVASSVVSAEPEEVKTLLFVNQLTTTGSGRPSIDLNRVELTLVESDGRWLVDDLVAL
jgi:Mce-associated membrane protein